MLVYGQFPPLTGMSLTLYLYNESGVLINSGGDAMTESPSSTGRFTATVAESPTGISSARAHDSGGVVWYGWLQQNSTVLVDSDPHIATGVPVTSLSSTAIQSIWTTTLTESYAPSGAEGTAAQLLYLIQQGFTEFAISGSTISVKKLNGSEAATYLMDSATAPRLRDRAT